MAFSISFSGASPGKSFAKSKSNRPMGEGFPSSKAIDHIQSFAIGSARTMAGDPTSTNSGGATVAFAQGIAALQLTRLLHQSITLRVIDGPGSLRIVTRKKGTFIDDMAAENFILNGGSRGMGLNNELVNIVKFLDKQGFGAIGPYSDIIGLFTEFSKKCRSGKFVAMIDLEG